MGHFMKSSALFFNLLWRTVVVCVAMGMAIRVAGLLLHVIGIDIPPPDVANTASFIILKPTLLYAAFAITLLFSEFGLRCNLVRMIAGGKLNISLESWHQYVVGLSVLLLTLSALNLLVSATTSTETWLTYKLFSALLFLAGIYVLVKILVWREHEQHH
jgi:intracellular septation protein A